MKLPVLETEKCILRLPNEGDVPALVKFYIENKEHLASWDPAKEIVKLAKLTPSSDGSSLGIEGAMLDICH